MPHKFVFTDSNSGTAIYLSKIADALYASKRCIVVTGAGISVDAGIPDFRSEDGLYNLVKAKYPNVVLKGRDLFDASLFNDPISTRLFYTFMSELRRLTANARLTRTHQFIKDIATSNRLLRCYTQNIDCLESRLGLTSCLATGQTRLSSIENMNGRVERGKSSPILTSDPLDSADAASVADSIVTTSSLETTCSSLHLSSQDSSMSTTTLATFKSSRPASATRTALQASSSGALSSINRTQVVQLHGNLETVVCAFCQTVSEFTDEIAALFDCGEPPSCSACENVRAIRMAQGKRDISVGLLRPNIVLYNEHHREGDKISQLQVHDMKKKPDMLIVMGTSLKVVGVRNLIKEFAKRVHATKNGICVFINATEVAVKEWESIFDYQVIGRSDDVVSCLWSNVCNLQVAADKRKLKREEDQLRREEKLMRQNATVTPIEGMLKKTKSAGVISGGGTSKATISSGSSNLSGRTGFPNYRKPNTMTNLGRNNSGDDVLQNPTSSSYSGIEQSGSASSLTRSPVPKGRSTQSILNYMSNKSQAHVSTNDILCNISSSVSIVRSSSPYSVMSNTSTVSSEESYNELLSQDKENCLSSNLMTASITTSTTTVASTVNSYSSLVIRSDASDVANTCHHFGTDHGVPVKSMPNRTKPVRVLASNHPKPAIAPIPSASVSLPLPRRAKNRSHSASESTVLIVPFVRNTTTKTPKTRKPAPVLFPTIETRSSARLKSAC
ncbi:NAD-dependent deacetylase hst3 [Batrachochytrium dendrobatidis]